MFFIYNVSGALSKIKPLTLMNHHIPDSSFIKSAANSENETPK